MMRGAFLSTPTGKMGISTRFCWDDHGTPTLVLTRKHADAAISLNDAHIFRDTPEATQYAAKIASALGLDYWSSHDRTAVLDTVYRNIDALVSMPPEPPDDLGRQKALRDAGVVYSSIRADGRTVLEEGL